MGVFVNSPSLSLMMISVLSIISSVDTPNTASLPCHTRSVLYESFGSTALCTKKSGLSTTLVSPTLVLVTKLRSDADASDGDDAGCGLGFSSFNRAWAPFEVTSYTTRFLSVSLTNVVYNFPFVIDFTFACQKQSKSSLWIPVIISLSCNIYKGKCFNVTREILLVAWVFPRCLSIGWQAKQQWKLQKFWIKSWTKSGEKSSKKSWSCVCCCLQGAYQLWAFCCTLMACTMWQCCNTARWWLTG